MLDIPTTIKYYYNQLDIWYLDLSSIFYLIWDIHLPSMV
jgi:hypothetical protein